jgi:hypothetical protein
MKDKRDAEHSKNTYKQQPIDDCTALIGIPFADADCEASTRRCYRDFARLRDT